jgi:outer membrane protein assembly factor BamA
MSGVWRCLVTSLFCVAAVSAAPVVREVQVRHTGATPVDESYVRTFISVAPGGELDRGKVGADIKRLLGAEGIDDAEALVEEEDGGVRLVYQVRPRLKLAGPV